MKLLIAVVQDSQCEKVLVRLIEKGYRATKLASTGGFLKNGNSTLLLGVEDEKTNAVISIIKENCRTREDHPVHKKPKVQTAGGAAIFTLDVEQYYKI